MTKEQEIELISKMYSWRDGLIGLDLVIAYITLITKVQIMEENK